MPSWPLPEPSARERKVWNRLWRLPQALIWEHHSQHDLVALYVRRFVEAEQPKAGASLNTLVRQLADSLLLTLPAMRAARVRVAEDEIGSARQQQPDQPEPESGEGMRDRLRAVSGEGG